jgi:hypothetical protein
LGDRKSHRHQSVETKFGNPGQLSHSSEQPQTTLFKKLADLLWPIGGAVLGFLVMPTLIEQYPDVFHNNRWLLPVSAFFVLMCFITPLLLHERAVRMVMYITRLPYQAPGLVLAALIPVALLVGFSYGGLVLFRFHQNHLAMVLSKESSSPTDPFFVTVEADFVTFPNGYFTGFWRFSDNQKACVIEPIEELTFIRIVNRSSIPYLITSYTVEMGLQERGQWQLLDRIDLRFGMVLYTAERGKVPVLPINAQSGGTNRAFFVASPAEVNYKQAAVVQLDSLDAQLAGGNSISAGASARGWAAFKVDHFYGMDLRISVIDGLNRSHQFVVPYKEKKRPNSDVMSRLIKFDGLVDVSHCEQRVRLPMPPPVH